MNICYVVSYDHGGLVLWGYEHFVHHFRDLLGWLDRHPKLKMGLDNEAWMYDWLAENQPAVLEEIRQALQRYAGRLGIATCTYGQPLAAYLLEESNIRQIALGIETTRERLGYEVTLSAFSEHAAFPQMPQVLVGLGLRGALMRTHYLMYGCCPGYDVPIAWWQGPDGSRVACVPTYRHQERQVPTHRAHPPGPYGLTTEDTWILTRYPSEQSPASLDSFRERFAHIRPLLASRLDDSGLKREELVTELDARDDYRWATLEDVFDQFPKPTTTISPSAEDFGTRMPWGYRGNELFDLARRAETAVLTAERLVARLAAEAEGKGKREKGKEEKHQGPSPVAKREQIQGEADLGSEGASPFSLFPFPFSLLIRQAWKDLLVGQHHDVQIVARAGTMGREHLLASLERSRSLLRTLLTAQATAAAPASGDYIAFNPLPWPRTEVTADLPDGALLPGTTEAPALGFAPLRSLPLPRHNYDGLAFETDNYRVRLNPDGGLAALSTRDGAPILRLNAVSGRLAGVIDGVACEAVGMVTAQTDAAGFYVTEKGKVGPLPYTAVWLFPRQGPRIEYRVTVRFDGERIGAPTTQKNDSRSGFTHEQKLRLRLFPAVDPATAFGLCDVPFGVSTTVRPYVEGNYWTALADASGGLAVANRGTMGSVREEDGAFSVPLAFSTNYIWGAEVICGERHWALALLPFEGDWRHAALHRRALEFAFPLVAVPGALAAPTPDFLRIDNPDIHLTAFYTAQEHGYLRLYNGSDREQTLPMTALNGAAPIAVDLWNREIGPRPTPLRLRPWEIVTLRLW